MIDVNPTGDKATDADPQRAGVSLKEAAQTVLAEFRKKQIRTASRAFVTKLLNSGRCTADDVQDALHIEPGVNPVYLGAVPKQFIKCGIITHDGFTTSGRRKAHGRPIAVWRLLDRNAAERWLVDNPEIVKPTPTPPAPISIPTTQPKLPGIDVSLGGYL